MGRYATIDIGSNSMKMYVAEVEGTRLRVLADEIEITRLGEALHKTGRIGEESMKRNVAVLGDFIERGRRLGVADFAVVGTMALRSASNAGEFADLVKKKFDVDLEIITGDEEARLASIAAFTGLPIPAGRICIFDAGGGSTEFVFLRDGKIERKFSLPVGTRRISEEHQTAHPVSAGDLERLLSGVSGEIGGIGPGAETLIGMGGTVTSLGSVMHGMKRYDSAAIHGSELSLDELNRQIDLFARLTLSERKEIVGLMTKRADVILAGAVIVKTIMSKLERTRLTISDHGLRHGLMHDRFVPSGKPAAGSL